MKLRIDPSRPKTFTRMVKEGRGQGQGENYKPWLEVRDLSSKGESQRLTGWRTGSRPLHLFSKLERDFFYRLEWDEAVTDYREQFPLDVRMTSLIAEKLNLPHPYSRQTGLHMTMTTDFLVTRGLNGQRELTAYYVKPFDELELLNAKRPKHVKHNWGKLRIEQEYWRQKKVNHLVVTERDFNRVLSRNVRSVHTYFPIGSLAPLDSTDVDRIHEMLFPAVGDGKESVTRLAAACDTKLGLPAGTCLKVAKHLIATRRWPVDFRVECDLCRPLKLIA